jgi:hypothetical protein
VLSDGNRVPDHSINRQKRLSMLVGSWENGGCSLETAKAALRDLYDISRNREAVRPTMSTVRRMDNLLSVVMRPARNEMWVSAGVQAETYQRLDLNELFDRHVMRRWVLRAEESSLSDAASLRPRGASLVIGHNPATTILRDQLMQAGGGPVEVSEQPQNALEVLDLMWKENPILHLFLMSGLDAQSPDMFSVFNVCRRWIERIRESNLFSQATLAAATSLGGDFGFSGHIALAEGGGVAGLLKAIRREFPELSVKIVDGSREESPDRVASAIMQELGSTSKEVEVGYRIGKRYSVRAIPRRAKSYYPVPLSRGGVWLVTGGSGGITGYVAQRLAEKLDLKMHVLGRNPESELTYPASYHCCDVSDAVALKSTLMKIRRKDGPIRGILHGAGVEVAARFDRKEEANVRATIASKVQGAINLMHLTRKDPLEVFLGFGSISGCFGGFGQTDYSLASEMLAKLIQRFRQERTECASIAFHWPAWDEIGMAMRTESRTALELAGQKFMPPQEGWDHLWAELESGACEGEVLILDGPGELDLDGSMQPASPAEVNMPLIEGITSADEDHCTAEIRFDPVADIFLKEHCYQGVPLLPAVVVLEALAEGSALFDDHGLLVLQDVEIGNGLRFRDQRPSRVRILVDKNNDGCECRLEGEFRNRGGRLIDPHRILASGKVRYETGGQISPVAAPGSMLWHTVEYPKAGPLIHGTSFRSLKELAFDDVRGFGRILAQTPEKLGGKRLGAWKIPLAELDACLVACGGYALKKLDVLALPEKFDRLQFFRQPIEGETCLVQFYYLGRKDGRLRFDFLLVGADNRAILPANGFAAVIVGQGKDL